MPNNQTDELRPCPHNYTTSFYKGHVWCNDCGALLLHKDAKWMLPTTHTPSPSKMKTFPEMFQDSIDMTDGSVVIWEKDYKVIQQDALQSTQPSAEVIRKAAEEINQFYYRNWDISLTGAEFACVTQILTRALSGEK